MKKIKPLSKRHRFRRWLKKLFGIKSPSAMFIDETHKVKPTEMLPASKKASVHLYYSEEDAALLFDLLSSEMDELMSLNTKNRLSEEPIFDQEQTEYLHRAMRFCAEQMKVLSKYVPVGGANDAT